MSNEKEHEVNNEGILRADGSLRDWRHMMKDHDVLTAQEVSVAAEKAFNSMDPSPGGDHDEVPVFDPRLIECAMTPHIDRELTKKRLKADKLYSDIRQDIAVAKEITGAIFDKQVEKTQAELNAQMLLSQSENRIVENNTAYVDVTGLSPLDAAKRVLKAQHSNDFVIPFDASEGLNDVDTTCDHDIAKLKPIMTLSSRHSEEDIPDRIVFVAPADDAAQNDPCGCRLTSEKCAHGNRLIDYEDLRYVRLDALPTELKSIVLQVMTFHTFDPTHEPNRREMQLKCLLQSIDKLRAACEESLKSCDERDEK